MLELDKNIENPGQTNGLENRGVVNYRYNEYGRAKKYTCTA